MNNIRRIAYSFGHGNIADLGLDAALESLCEEFATLTGTDCDYTSSFREDMLSYEVKLDIYRVCQGALLNTMQHADASRVAISLEEKNDRLLLVVSDNGKGFSRQETGFGAGLTTMQGRALSINGQLIVSSDENGTVVELELSPDGEE